MEIPHEAVGDGFKTMSYSILYNLRLMGVAGEWYAFVPFDSRVSDEKLSVLREFFCCVKCNGKLWVNLCSPPPARFGFLVKICLISLISPRVGGVYNSDANNKFTKYNDPVVLE